MTDNKAYITACEINKIRAERLKYNIEKQGAKGINVLCKDSRNLDDFLLFDKILLDTPCSGSGTINLNKKDKIQFTNEYEKKLENMQISLIKKAIKLLKVNGELIYSTCSLLYNENQKIIKEVLDTESVELVPLELKDSFKELPKLNIFFPGVILLAPTDVYEGFFIAKLRKVFKK